MRHDYTQDTPLRIAMFGHKRIPGREGGIEVVVEELSVRMVERGIMVTCYNRSRHQNVDIGCTIDGQVIYKGIQLKKVCTIDKRGIAAALSSCLAAVYTAFGHYDIVHIHAEGSALLCWLPRVTGKKVIVTIHGLDYKRQKWGWFASKYIKLGEKSAAKFANEIIVLSQNARMYFWEKYKRKTVYIPNGVSRPTVKEAGEIRRKWCLDKDSYILFLGRLVPEKGIQLLLNIWSDIKTDKKLVIAGEGSDTNRFVKSLKEMENESIVFTGFVYGEELEELYSNAYIYVLPSMLEGMPLSLLEAMSYGNCCLVSDIPECTEVIGDMAESFHVGDANDLKLKLQKLCDDPMTVQEYKSKVTTYVLEKYNWDEVVDETIALYLKKE